jgi:hypothetical protein
MAMQVAALCYCNTYLTDGFVPRSVVSGLLDLEGLGMRMWAGELVGGGEDANWRLIVQDLLAAGLWDEAPGGYRIHDYHEYQPSKDQVLKEREQKKLAGQKGGLASAQARASARGQAPASAAAQAPPQAESKPVPVPVPYKEADASSCPRSDVERCCQHLAQRIADNGSKRPRITQKWRDAARLMIDTDGRTETQVIAAIDWCQNDEFWRSNILSMPKLRERYDQLRLAAQRTNPAARRGNPYLDDLRAELRVVPELEAR